MRRTRVLLVILAAVVLAAPLALAGATYWAEARFDEYDARWREALAPERARLAARTVPIARGTPEAGDACPRLRVLLEGLHEAGLDAEERSALDAAVEGPPGTTSPAVAELLEARAELLAETHRLLKLSRCDWQLPYEDGPRAQLPRWNAATQLDRLLLAEAQAHAAAGEHGPALDGALEALRLGGLIGSSTLLSAMVATAVEDRALGLIGRFVSGGPPLPADLLATLDDGLARLAPVLPDPQEALGAERLATGPARTLLDAPPSLGRPVSVVAAVAVARALPELEEGHRDAAALGAAADRAEQKKVQARLHQRARTSSGGPLAATIDLDFLKYRSRMEATRARHALVRAAIAVERARPSGGSYATDLAAAGVALPVDPFAAPAPIRFEALDGGAGYRLWSAGPDGADQKGAAGSDDVVLERAAGAAPAKE